MSMLGQMAPQDMPEHLNVTLKTQWIRLADVLFVGPLMVYGGVALARQERPLLGVLLGALGLGTIVFNGRNWYLVRQAQLMAVEEQRRLAAQAQSPEVIDAASTARTAPQSVP